ncbi:hypothetical protein IT157_02065 [bacterium]|jgi:hypothetical protein|nr:hypothetical protein [bacterium]
MAKKQSSALHNLLVSLRRVTLLLVTAFSLAMGWPLQVVAMRVFVLWIILALLTQAGEVLFQYLVHRALQREMQQSAHATGATQ